MAKVFEAVVKYRAVGECDNRAMTSTSDVVAYMEGAFDGAPMQEQFYCILLNGSNKAIGRHLCTVGLANSCQVHAREAFRAAIVAGAVSVIFVHNHPSGNREASPEDIRVTGKLVEAGRLLDIPVLDHLICADGWTSIRGTHNHLFK